MSCNLYQREYCIAEEKKIDGHKRRYCPKCRAVYQKNYRQRIAKIIREHRERQ